MLSPDTKVKVQNFGRFLSNMVMPNIGAFIAWGIITALFIPTGWFPNATLVKLVGPMITYLLPLLIGFTGGRLVGESAVAWLALSPPWAWWSVPISRCSSAP
ncbi:PTS system mannitol-specific EIICBA component [Dickeya solani]|nr:PTS system mannitol-specific EIICBA component [Dickeya solani]